MTRATLIRFGIAAALLGGIGAAPADDQNSSLNALTVKMAALEQANSKLAQENAKLKDQVRQLQVQLVLSEKSVKPTTRPTVPNNWTQRQFNGITYYLVPLDGGQSAPTSNLIAK